MLIVEHRRNSISELLTVPRSHGVEIDVRSEGGRLFLSHDSFSGGEDFRAWLQHYEHKFLVVNVKEENLEAACRELFVEFGIQDYFFLDQASPQLIRSCLLGWRDGACRWSEFEDPNKDLLALCDWVWVDSFLPGSVPHRQFAAFQAMGLKVCLVSPELHGQDREPEAKEFARRASESGSFPDAVCTKSPHIWRIV